MCENTIHYLSKLLHNAYFVILSNFVEETESRLKNAIRFDKIEVRPRTASFHAKKVQNGISILIDKVLFRYRNLIKQLKDCKVIIVLGGDDISEYYGIIRLLDILLRLRYLKRAGKKIYLLGQSIGPMQSWRIGLARKVLGRMDKIYYRGWRNHNYVTQVLKGENNSSFSSDLAFLDLARQNEAFDIEKYNIQHQRYITFVPSGFWAGYSNNYEAYLEGLIGIANYITQKCEALDMRMVLLPHVLRWTDDVRVVKEMVNRLGGDRIVGIDDVLLPFQARAILGSSHFVVTQKMHGAISSLQMGVPALCLSFSVKFSEVIGEYLGLPELVVEVRKDHFKEDMGKGCSSIEFALQNQAILRSKIEKAVIKVKRDAMVQIEDLAKDMISY